MYLDAQTLLSDSQAITGTAASTNYIDRDAVNSAIGTNHELGEVEVFCQIDAAFNTLTSLTIDVETDDNSSFSSATVMVSKSVLLAGLSLNAQIFLGKLGAGAWERYIRGNYTVVGTDPTTGSISMGIIQARQSNK